MAQSASLEAPARLRISLPAMLNSRPSTATGRSSALPVLSRESGQQAESRTRRRGANVAREPCGVRPLAARRGRPEQRPRDDRGTPGAEPAGGTTTPFVRWTIGAILFSGETSSGDGHRRRQPNRRPRWRRPTTPQDVEPRDLRALAGCRRLRARRRGQPRRLVEAAVRDHPAAAQRHRRAAHRPRPDHDGRGRDGPPRADAGPPDAVGARRRPRLDRRAGRARRDHRRGRRDARTRSAASATSSGCGSSSTRRATIIADQQRRLGVSVDWSRLRFTMDEGSAEAVRVAFKRLYDDGLAYRGEQLINWCPGDLTSLSDLEVIATPTKGTLWYGPLPLRRRRRRGRSRRDDHRRHDAARDDPRRHGGGRPSGRRALRRRSSAAAC